MSKLSSEVPLSILLMMPLCGFLNLSKISFLLLLFSLPSASSLPFLGTSSLVGLVISMAMCCRFSSSMWKESVTSSRDNSKRSSSFFDFSSRLLMSSYCFPSAIIRESLSSLMLDILLIIHHITYYTDGNGLHKMSYCAVNMIGTSIIAYSGSPHGFLASRRRPFLLQATSSCFP